MQVDGRGQVRARCCHINNDQNYQNGQFQPALQIYINIFRESTVHLKQGEFYCAVL